MFTVRKSPRMSGDVGSWGQPARLDPGAFHLVHAGGLSLSYRRRDVSVLLQALEPAARQRAAQGFPPLVLHILGRLSEAEEDALARADLRCVCHGPVSLDRSRALQAAADALLLWIPEESLALPGKYAEYVQSGRPVVYLGPEKWRRLAPAGSGFLAPDALRALRLDGGALRDPMTQAAHAGEVFADFLQTADQTEEDRGGSDQGAALSGWERVAHTRLSPAFTVSGQIQVEDLDALKAAGVRTLICNRPDDETQDQPRAQEIGARAAQLGMRFHHVPMSPGQMTDALVTKLGDILKRNPVAVHAYCRSGRRSQKIFERLTQDLNADRDPLG